MKELTKKQRSYIVIALFALAALLIFTNLRSLQEGYIHFIGWFKENPFFGIIMVILVYPVATVIFFPTFLIQIGFGFALYHVISNLFVVLIVGTIIIWICATLGSLAAMLIGRYILSDTIRPCIVNTKYFRGIDIAIQEEGFKFMLLLRLSPIIPFNVLNYVMSLTSIKLLDFLKGGIGMFPTDMMYVYVGTSLKSISEIEDTGKEGNSGFSKFFFAVGACIGIYAVYTIAKHSKRKMDEIMSRTESQQLLLLRKYDLDYIPKSKAKSPEKEIELMIMETP